MGELPENGIDRRQQLLKELKELERKAATAKLSLFEERRFVEEKFWSSFVEKDEGPLNLSPLEAEALGASEIYTTLLGYRGSTRRDLGYWILTMAQSLPDKETVSRTVKAISKYKGYTAAIIGSNLALQAEFGSRESERLKLEAMSPTAGPVNFDPLQYKHLKQEFLDEYSEKCAFFSSPQVVQFISSKRNYDERTAAISLAIDAFAKFKDVRALEVLRIARKIGLGNVGLVPYDYFFEAIDKGLGEVMKNSRSLTMIAACIRFSKEAGKSLTPAELLPFLSSRYGLKEPIAPYQLQMLIAAENVSEVIRIANSEQRMFVTEYPVSVASVTERKEARERHIRDAVIAIVGSKDKKKEADARSVVADIAGSGLLDKARNEFRLKYKQILPEMLKHLPDYRGAAKLLLRTIIRAEHSRASSEDEAEESREPSAISRVLGKMAFAINGTFVIDLKAIRAFETKNPFEYDFRVQDACVYLPNSEHIINYANNDKCILVKYEAVGPVDPIQEIGSAICYLDRGRFLVDSIEGHTVFMDKEIFDVVYTDLVARAKRYNSELLLFGEKGANEVPKAFVGYLRSQKLPEVRVDLDLPKNKDELYLETKKGSLAFALRLSSEKKEMQAAMLSVARAGQQKVYNNG